MGDNLVRAKILVTSAAASTVCSLSLRSNLLEIASKKVFVEPLAPKVLSVSLLDDILLVTATDKAGRVAKLYPGQVSSYLQIISEEGSNLVF